MYINLNNQNSNKFDLKTRTSKFGESIIKFAKKIPVNLITQRLIPQLVGAGTSVGANYCEADNAETRKDFRHKMGICKKESEETKHWLRMIIVAVPAFENDANLIWAEAGELNLIFNKSVITSKKYEMEKLIKH
jgi:four helix bundle protein